ncbi:unnamed protein product [Sphagnum troendelagicum]|uniref:Uncharacterized protein n=1 Tax=Sphagnum troendelagicum TaxID=128251 RepID=A0ABP0USF4_9BRYO
MAQRKVQVLTNNVLMLTLTMVLIFHAPASVAVFNETGSDKDSWPELLFANITEALQVITESNFVPHVYVQPPDSGTPPAQNGTSQDLWIYTDGLIVYEIPKRGVWHPNRLSPGWPDLVGKEHELAMQQIHCDVMGLTIMYGPKGFFRVGDVSLSRVWLDINPDGTVAYVPSIG